MLDDSGFNMGLFSIYRTLTLIGWLAFGMLTRDVALAQNIRGSVQNLTRSQPAVGDEVILVRMEQMAGGIRQEAESHARTDARGSFLLPVLHRDKSYLVRVMHQGVTYDGQVSPGDNLSISVFDASPKVAAVAGSIEILRISSPATGDQKLLHISDMYEIRNESNPPITRAGTFTFGVYLPANGRITSVLAAGPGPKQATRREAVREKISQMISAAPVAGEPGHYTVNFPLRPGETRFAFNYDVPYPGHVTFRTRHEYGLQQFAVMVPATMHFSSPSAAFQRLATDDKKYQVRAIMPLKPGEGPSFEISENGSTPSLEANEQQYAQSLFVLPSSTIPISPSAAPAPPRNDSKFERTPLLWPWQVLAGCLLLACVSLLVLLRKLNRRLAVGTVTESEPRASPTVAATSLESLKEELFQLEASRARGFISAEEYSSAKSAFGETLDALSQTDVTLTKTCARR